MSACPSPRRAWTWPGLRHGIYLGLALGLFGCSTAQIAYNKLDWAAYWELRKFVKLNPEQRELYDQEFDALWIWHRRHELPRYAVDLRELALQTARPVSSEDLLDWNQRASQHWNRIVNRAAPAVCRQLKNFNAEQLASIRQRLDHNIEESREKYVTAPEHSIQKDAEIRLIRRLQRWLGKLNKQQLEQVRQWNRERELGYADWVSYQHSWSDALTARFENRQTPEFCQSLRTLFLRNDATGQLSLHIRNDDRHQQWAEFLASMLSGMTSRQRQHLHDRLTSLAADFDNLAKQ